MWTSPFRHSTYRSHAITKYIIPFTVIAGTLIATDSQTGEVLPNTTDQEIWSGRVSQFGAWYSLSGLSGATYLMGRLTGNAHATETGLLGLQALGHAQVAVFAFKQLTNRERPRDARGDFWGGGTSFPSGHSASAFAVATVFAYEYRHHIAVPLVAYSLAGAVASSRLSARRHWVSDIVVGGSLGFLIGRATYKRNHNPDLPGSPVTRSARLIPQVQLAGTTVALSWQL
jgi:membrane-associated phospholipid phosphatase